MLSWREPARGRATPSNGQTMAWPSAPSRALRVMKEVNAAKREASAAISPRLWPVPAHLGTVPTLALAFWVRPCFYGSRRFSIDSMGKSGGLHANWQN